MARRSLKKLIRKPFSIADFLLLPHHKETESDRAVAILAATQVEDSLESAILSRLSPKLTKRDIAELFENEGPISTFSSKIRMAFALRLFGHEVRTDLNCIREIRNVFAHARAPIKFDTPEVAEAVATIKTPDRANVMRELIVKAQLKSDPVNYLAIAATMQEANASARKRYIAATDQRCIDLENEAKRAPHRPPVPSLP